ncbi:hypothetical protein [Vibrio sp. B181a]|uniref:hypothetical protein n=1 Tax=Vibrio sp. B181a TaxID=2835906 RepID=UPI0025574575|nr:hypothetical protein [Vibrio sp. B181a]MDK9773411.1 hypothetical protein [Vibrio sp. B181a]
MKSLNNSVQFILNKANFIYISIIIFLFVFNPYLFNSNGAVIFAFILSLIYVRNETVNIFFYFIKRKENLALLALFTIPYIYALYGTVIDDDYDFSKLQKIIKFSFIFICAMWYSSIIIYQAKHSVQRYLNSIVILQLIIVILCLISPDFTELIRGMNDPSALEKLSDYGAYRGVSWAANAFFGLAVILSFIILNWMVDSYEKGQRSVFIYLFLFLTLIVFTVTARTTFLAIIFFLTYLFFRMSVNSKFVLLKITSFVILFFVSLSFILYYCFPDLVELILSIMNRSLEFVFNYIKYGSFSSGSTDILQSMYFPVDKFTLMFGDYRYMDGSSYYMDTDAGYMRNVLYWGIVGMFLNFMFAFLINYRIYGGLNYRFAFFSMFLFVLHIKGEVVSHENMLYSALFLMYCSSVYNQDLIKHEKSKTNG